MIFIFSGKKFDSISSQNLKSMYEYKSYAQVSSYHYKYNF